MWRSGSRSAGEPYLLAGALALGGCDATVALGGDCLPLGEECGETRDPVVLPPDASAGETDGDGEIVHPPPTRDGGELPEAGSADMDGGWPISDASMDASQEDAAQGDAAQEDADVPAIFPSLHNLSFELQNGSSAGDFGGTLSDTDISPWYHCQVPGGSSLRVEEAAGDVVPTEGSAFMAFQYPYWADLPVPVYQSLEQPLLKGQTYSFMVDLRAEGVGVDGMIALGVRGGTVRCSALKKLADTGYLQAGRWESRCVRFTPSEDMSELSLLPVVKGVIAVTFKLYADNIREDPSCQ